MDLPITVLFITLLSVSSVASNNVVQSRNKLPYQEIINFSYHMTLHSVYCSYIALSKLLEILTITWKCYLIGLAPVSSSTHIEIGAVTSHVSIDAIPSPAKCLITVSGVKNNNINILYSFFVGTP